MRNSLLEEANIVKITISFSYMRYNSLRSKFSECVIWKIHGVWNTNTAIYEYMNNEKIGTRGRFEQCEYIDIFLGYQSYIRYCTCTSNPSPS